MISKTLRSSIFAVLIGGGLEWYEFSLYVFLSPVIAKQYFSNYPPETGLILTALIFALGFLSRPLGGLFFGHIGDRFGRKIAMLVSIIMITIPTFGIGLIPHTSNLLVVPILLLFLRLLQGMLTGGELPGMVCYLTEGVPPNKERLISSLVFVGTQTGLMVAICECIILEKQLTPEEFLQWGWRASFIVGGLIGLTGCLLRSQLKETHPFVALQQHHHVSRRPILNSLFNHKKNMLIAILLVSAPLASDFLILSYSSVYLQTALHFTPASSLALTGFVTLIATLFLPLFGKIGDLFPNKPLFVICTICMLLIAYPLYYCTSRQMPIGIALAVMAALLNSCYFALIPYALAQLFPTTVRYSCIGLSYNLGASLFGGTAPLFAMLLIKGTGNLTSPCLVLIATSLISLVGISMLKEKKSIE